MRVIAPLVAVALALAGCAEFSAASCPAGMQDMWHAELLFGRNAGNQPGVSDGDWQGFVAAEIAPRFPAGFTVIDAAGQWRGENGSTVREPSKVVVVIAPAGAETRARFDAIAEAYKLRFHQDSVGIVLAPACVSF